MRVTVKGHRSHEGREYSKVIPIPDSRDDEFMIGEWSRIFKEDGNIIHSFFDEMDPLLRNIMKGERGVIWEYLPLNEDKVNWPFEFIIYRI